MGGEVPAGFGGPGGSAIGGAITTLLSPANSVELIMKDCHLERNSAVGSPGGRFDYGDTHVSVAVGSGGSAFGGGLTLGFNGEARITNTTFESNSAIAAAPIDQSPSQGWSFGGAISMVGAKAHITGSKFFNNYVSVTHSANASSSDPPLILPSGKLALPTRASYGGGAIQADGDLSLDSSSFVSNSVVASIALGGAILLEDIKAQPPLHSKTSITNTIFSNNSVRHTDQWEFIESVIPQFVSHFSELSKNHIIIY